MVSYFEDFFRKFPSSEMLFGHILVDFDDDVYSFLMLLKFEQKDKRPLIYSLCYIIQYEHTLILTRLTTIVLGHFAQCRSWSTWFTRVLTSLLSLRSKWQEWRGWVYWVSFGLTSNWWWPISCLPNLIRFVSLVFFSLGTFMTSYGLNKLSFYLTMIM